MPLWHCAILSCMNVFEIEIKSLLGEERKANELRKKLQIVDPKTVQVSKHKQLNHYFIDGDIDKLHKLISSKLSSKKKQDQLKKIVTDGSDFSIRTRLADDTVLFVVKASLDEGTSHNDDK